MAHYRAASLSLFWLGIALVALAVVVVASTVTNPDRTMEDLGAIAGALLLTAASGVAFGLSLLAGAAGRARVARWRIALAGAFAAFSVASAVGLLQVALQAPNWGLIAFGVVVLAAAGSGLASSVPLWRRARAAA